MNALAVAKWSGAIFGLLMVVSVMAAISGGQGGPEDVVFLIAAIPLVVCVSALIVHARRRQRPARQSPHHTRRND